MYLGKKRDASPAVHDKSKENEDASNKQISDQSL